MSALSQQLFISVRGFLVLMGRVDDQELLLFDPGIKAVLKTYTESNKFGKDKVAFSAVSGNLHLKPDSFVTQSSNKSVLSYFNMHAVGR